MENGFQIKEYPEKSWSISKMKIIDECYREYYYTYYGSHNGWIWDSSDEQKIAWRLKKLTNIWLMFGDKLHIVIKKIIESNQNSYDIVKIKNYMRNQLNIGVKESLLKYRDGSWDEYPKGEMLQEYYYGDKLRDKDVQEIKDRIDLCVDNFFKSQSYGELKRNNTKILEVDEGKFDYIMIHGVKVFALIDALYIDEEGKFVIVDWKTGRFSDYDREQLLVYVLYVMEKYHVKLENIIGRVEYLLTGEHAEYSFKESDINEIKNRVNVDLNVIDAFLIDSDLNIPRPKEDFRKCDSINKCKKCKYRKLCMEDLEEY